MSTKTKNAKVQKKTMFLAAVSVAVILGIATGIALLASKKPVLAFYDIPENVAANIRQILGSSFSYTTYNADRPLAWELEQTARPAMVITPSGQGLAAAKAAVPPKIRLNANTLKDMTTSIRALTQTNKEKNIKALPLLTSHLEISVNTQDLKKSGVKNINSWNDLERFAIAASEKNGKKILFAGKDSGLFLDMVGGMAESISGKRAYENAVQLIEIAVDKTRNGKKNTLDAAVLAQSLAGSPDTPLYDALRMLNRWYNEGIIFSEAFSIDQKSVEALMSNKLASAVFMTLNDHRAVDHNVIDKYASIYFPSNIPAYSRAFTAPVYFALPLKNNKSVIEAALQLTATAKQQPIPLATETITMARLLSEVTMLFVMQ